MNILKKKGQAALEFLTTYGWAFMVILVMIGALAYFGVLNPQKLIPDQCAITSGFTCSDFSVGTATSSFSFLNNMGEPINVTNFAVMMSSVYVVSNDTLTGTGANLCQLSTGYGTAIPDGTQFKITDCTTATGFTGKPAGSKVKLAFAFDYVKTGSGSFAHTASGTITATLK